MQRYFTDKIIDNITYLNEDDSYHLRVVMRANINDSLEIVNNNKLYLGKVVTLNDNIKVKIEKEIEEHHEYYHVDIAQALIKDKKMDFVLQKSTELGVNNIIPLITTRSVVKITDRSNKKIERYNKIVKEASSQSKRLKIPKVLEFMTIDDLINLDYDIKILCSVNEASISLKKVFHNTKISDRILFVVGPEGGFTDIEEQKMIDHGFIRVTLGKNVLRTETTSLYILSVVSYNFMR